MNPRPDGPAAGIIDNHEAFIDSNRWGWYAWSPTAGYLTRDRMWKESCINCYAGTREQIEQRLSIPPASS